jgi:acyl-CoA synthetase (AMP-forming)/AMP-acid ligase II
MDPLALLSAAARRRPSAPAVLCGAVRLTYPDLDRLADRLAGRLAAGGARAGDRVAALLPNCHLYLALYFAALRAGLVLVPLNTRLAAAEIRAVLEHSGARLLAGDPERVAGLTAAGEPAGAGPAPGGPEDGLRVAPVEAIPGVRGGEAVALRPPEDATHLYYTSGTTGRPKGVLLTRGNLAAHARLTLGELAFRESDVWLHAAPMFHLADAWAIWTVTAAAATHVMLPRFEARAACDRIAAAGVTITNLVPTMLIALLEEAERGRRTLPSLRLLLSGGAPIAPSVVERIDRVLGCDYVQTYGLTETSPFLTFSLPDGDLRRLPPSERARHRARAGRPVRGVEVRVVTPPPSAELRDVPADDVTVGEVVARGPTVTPGYWRDPQGTAEAFRGGWFHTGDLGTVDARGSINLVDRAKDVIVTGGETVYSTEVENALYAHPGVVEAAAYGVPDERWGEAVRAAVVLRDPGAASAAELAAFCRGRIAGYKCPAVIDLVAALPRTGSGKIDKKVLRAPFWAGCDRQIH